MSAWMGPTVTVIGIGAWFLISAIMRALGVLRSVDDFATAVWVGGFLIAAIGIAASLIARRNRAQRRWRRRRQRPRQSPARLG